MKNTTLTALSLAAALFAGQALAADTAHGPDGKPGMARHGMQEADTNHDGAISKEEFHAQGDKMFDRLDTNHDGKISQDEREARRKEFEAKRGEWKAKHDGAEAPAKAN